MESGTIVRWLKAEGDAVEKGEPLYELDTDKVTQEVEADASGVLLRISVQEGEVEVGHTIAVIGKEGEEVSEPKEEAPKAEAPAEKAPPPVRPRAPGRPRRAPRPPRRCAPRALSPGATRGRCRAPARSGARAARP